MHPGLSLLAVLALSACGTGLGTGFGTESPAAFDDNTRPDRDDFEPRAEAVVTPTEDGLVVAHPDGSSQFIGMAEPDPPIFLAEPEAAPGAGPEADAAAPAAE